MQQCCKHNYFAPIMQQCCKLFFKIYNMPAIKHMFCIPTRHPISVACHILKQKIPPCLQGGIKIYFNIIMYRTMDYSATNFTTLEPFTVSSLITYIPAFRLTSVIVTNCVPFLTAAGCVYTLRPLISKIVS